MYPFIIYRLTLIRALKFFCIFVLDFDLYIAVRRCLRAVWFLDFDYLFSLSGLEGLILAEIVGDVYIYILVGIEHVFV
jgi:hypothetical protein